ncbi:unnamed protein product, partial [Mesorhabditis belari]|uniref:Uncharacterized protein n=1 Tax=Mesorhabditis belari TaxID=2138241 RepID=A0AAF3EUZ8_9BILA
MKFYKWAVMNTVVTGYICDLTASIVAPILIDQYIGYYVCSPLPFHPLVFHCIGISLIKLGADAWLGIPFVLVTLMFASFKSINGHNWLLSWMSGVIGKRLTTLAQALLPSLQRNSTQSHVSPQTIQMQKQLFTVMVGQPYRQALLKLFGLSKHQFVAVRPSRSICILELSDCHNGSQVH